MSRARRWRRSMDQVSAWLPALLMMVFALATGWLVRNTPGPGNAADASLVRAGPDYFMRDFSVRSFDATGRLKSELTGVEGQHFPATDTLEVRQPRMRSIDEEGRPTVATAQRGESNGDGSEVKLFGDARVVREATAKPGGGTLPRLEFRGEFLHAFVDEDRVSSDQPVELKRGDDSFTADTFDYDDRSGVANLRGRVQGVIQPGSTALRRASAAPPAAGARR